MTGLHHARQQPQIQLTYDVVLYYQRAPKGSFWTRAHLDALTWQQAIRARGDSLSVHRNCQSSLPPMNYRDGRYLVVRPQACGQAGGGGLLGAVRRTWLLRSLDALVPGFDI